VKDLGVEGQILFERLLEEYGVNVSVSLRMFSSNLCKIRDEFS
jgi:hypothetical protein